MKTQILYPPPSKPWFTHVGPNALVLVSLLLAGAAVTPVPAQTPLLGAPAQGYLFKTVDAPGKDLTNNWQYTWINDVGLVVQQYLGTDGFVHTASLFGSGKWTEIAVPGAANTGATNPNLEGQVALSYWGADWVMNLALWQRGHITLVSNPSPGYEFSGAQGINDLGQVTALVWDSAGTGLGYVGNSGKFKVFGFPGSPFTYAFMTNDFGTSVGFYYDSGWVQHAFVYNIYTGNHSSLDVPGGTNAQALAINNEGAIVGSYTDASGNTVGFKLIKGRLTAFDVPTAQQTIPCMVSDMNVVTGIYQTPDGNWHGFIATPVAAK